MHHFDGHFWGMHFIWWIVWLFAIIGIFWYLKNPSFRGVKKDEPLQILKK